MDVVHDIDLPGRLLVAMELGFQQLHLLDANSTSQPSAPPPEFVLPTEKVSPKVMPVFKVNLPTVTVLCRIK